MVNLLPTDPHHAFIFTGKKGNGESVFSHPTTSMLNAAAHRWVRSLKLLPSLVDTDVGLQCITLNRAIVIFWGKKHENTNRNSTLLNKKNPRFMNMLYVNAHAEEMPLTRAAHGTSKPSPPLGWCTADEPLSTVTGWHGWWQQPRSAASLLQQGKVSARMEAERCRRARLSVATEAAAEVSLMRGDNVVLTLQRCAAWPHGKHGQVGCGRAVLGTRPQASAAIIQLTVPAFHFKVKA